MCTASLGAVRTINIARGESHSIFDIVNTIAISPVTAASLEPLPRPLDA